MFIQTQTTPNPSTLKFLPGQKILEIGGIEFTDAQTAGERSPLAARLFGLQGVATVFLGTDFVSVTKADDTDWSMLKPMVLAALMEHLSMGQAVMVEGATDEQAASAQSFDDPVVAQIVELIDTRVRPSVAMDGGDIVFDRFEDGVVYLHMRGACAGCPSSTMTLKQGIENMLKHFVPEVREVRPAAM